MTEDCGCCTGVEIAVPATEVNPPGLSALTYRVGTYATFFETMVARLTGLMLTVPSPSGSGTQTPAPLAGLTTRDPSDPSLALLDAWAVVADVLSFYQERIANEGYLPTAVQRRSVLELARLIGYRLRPGVAASVRLAFTVANGFQGTIPAGTRAQSIPNAGQNPQFFETSVALDARDSWNALAPRLTRPQLITPAGNDDKGNLLVTGADVIDTVYFAGVATNLKPGDALFFIFGPDANPNPRPPQQPQQYMRLISDIDVQADQKRTEATLALVVPPGRSPTVELTLYQNKALFLFPGSDLAQEVVAILQPIITNLKVTGGDRELIGPLLQAAISRITLKRSIAVQREFTRVAAWLASLLRVLQLISLGTKATLLQGTTTSAAFVSPPDETPALLSLPAGLSTSPLENLVTIVQSLAKAPSRQPANPLRLSRTIATSFSPQSDNAPRLLAAFNPTAAPTLYQAWSAIATPAGRVEVYAARVKAGLFASNWMGPATVTITQNRDSTTTTTFRDPTIASAWGSTFADLRTQLDELPLDATYDQIKPGSWVAIGRPRLNSTGAPTGTPTVTFHMVISLRTANLAAGSAMSSDSPPTTDTGSGFAAKATLLTLDPRWLSEVEGTSAYATNISATLVLRQTTVHAQSEPLALTEEPLDTDVERNSIDLAQVYDGLEPGRWIVVSGTRTAIPNVSGVQASELAMIGAVMQGSDAPQPKPFPLTSPPFAGVYYITDANAYGDRLVVGQLVMSGGLAPPPPPAPGIASPPPSSVLDDILEPDFLNQQFSGQVQLAAGVYANAYVPSSDERSGLFPAFTGLLVHPDTRVPYPNGQIDRAALAGGLFAWRVSTEALHTILSLASPLAYSYDRSSVTIYGNVVDATQGQSTGEVLGNGDATVAFSSFGLSQSPLTYVSAATPSGASSTLGVQVNELEWHEVNDLADAMPTQRCYVTSEDDAQKTAVTFGNGVHGARLPTGTANIKATYRYGMGSSGNVDAGQISQLATHPLGAQAVINPLPASGGADPDCIYQARANAPVAVMALDRLVSVRDYADFARNFAGIGKAVAVLLSDGRRQLVHVTIAGAEDIPIDQGSDLYNNLVRSLQQYGDPSQPFVVAIRRVRLIVMAASVGLLPDYLWEDVAPNLRAAILALFSFDVRALGQTAFLSEAIGAAQQVEGVAWLNVTTFDGVSENITAEKLAALGSAGKLGLKRRPYIEGELARAGRIVAAELVFMTPKIPDTLILSLAD
jgi:hypothetical protein